MKVNLFTMSGKIRQNYKVWKKKKNPQKIPEKKKVVKEVV